MCGVAAVATEYAAGPASAATSAAVAAAEAMRGGRWCTPTIRAALTKPTTSTSHRSQGCHDASRARSSKESAAVRAVVRPSTPVAARESRCRHSTKAPVPTSAPIPGASATV